MTGEQPDVQVIANLVVLRGDGRVLLVRHDPDDERWWLPGEDLRPYQHPDERAREVLEELGGLTCSDLSMVFVESFRGRRGWHVVFHYRGDVEGDPSGDLVEPAGSSPTTSRGRCTAPGSARPSGVCVQRRRVEFRIARGR